MRKRARKTAGVTMVELMVALAIMAIAIMGVMAVMLHTIKNKEKMRELDIAKQAAATKLEQLRSYPWDNDGPGLEVFPTPHPTVYGNWTVPELGHTSSADKRAFGTVTIRNDLTADPNPELLDLEVTIFWVGVDGATSYSARSMFTR